MGYYSDYSGSFTPTTKLSPAASTAIKKWFVDRFGWYGVKDSGVIEFDREHEDGYIEYYTGDIYFDDINNAIFPVSGNMKGYSFNNHLYEFVEWLKITLPHVKFMGEIERVGEEFGDFECVKIDGDKVKSYQGHIAWDNPTIVCETEAQKDVNMEAIVSKMIGGGI